MMPNGIIDFLRGGTMVALIASSLYFFRFWKDTRDRLFLLLGLAFAVLSVSQAAAFWYGSGDSNPLVYWLRLFAFLLIIAGIVEKNLPVRNEKSEE